MKEYIISVSLTAIVAMIASAVTPTIKRGEIAPYVRLVSSFVIICVIISPFTVLSSCDLKADADSFISKLELNSSDFYEKITAETLSKLNAIQLSSALTSAICEKFEIEADDVTVEIQYTVSNEKTEYSRILVLLYGKAIFKDSQRIEKYINELCEIECDCAVG